MEIDGSFTLETPENVEVQFELAGPGSRFCAMMIDAMLIGLTLFVLGMLAMIFQAGIGSFLNEAGPGGGEDVASWLTWVNALIVLILTAILFGYHVFFEWVMRGQTPGKRSMKIRVIRDDGTPVTAMDIVVRNLIRMVDFLPVFYGLGGLVAFWNGMNKRLGDMAAGTIVIKEAEVDYRARADKKYELPVAAPTATNAELSPDERRLVRNFLQRRGELLPEARHAMAQRLSEPLYQKFGGLFVSPESFLERLIEGRHHGA